MRTLLIGTAAVVTLALIGSPTWGQEAIATPNPVAAPQAGAAGGVHVANPARVSVLTGPGGWRYRRPYYYPGVAVGVGPYGNVGVGVGRRVGVDVWGPLGAVRVGRIGVGW